MRTLSMSELNAVTGGTRCAKPVKKPKCKPMPKPKMGCMALIAKIKAHCGTPAPTPEDDPIVGEG